MIKWPVELMRKCFTPQKRVLGIEHSETKLCISTLNDWEVDVTTERSLSYLSNRFNVAMLFDITRNSYVMEEIRPA